MKCPECQTENQETRKFCRECGAKLILFCPQCSSANLPGDKFCGECGFDLGKPKEVPPIDYAQPQSYTPNFLANKILTTRSAIEGERKLVTVLFADVANYTSIAEKLDPEDVHQIMDGCFKIMMDEIHSYEGTINQFTGDGIMAIFGAPLAHEDHAQRACHAALSTQKSLKKYAEKIKGDYNVGFQMRIGLNSGLVVIGSIGDDLRMDYTAVGDTTNLASRMESMAMPGAILVSKSTYRLTRDFFEFKSLGEVEVKGKEYPQEAFELTKVGEVETRIEAAVAKGLTRFVGRKNSMAALIEGYEKAKSGSGQIVGIVGEAGVGKSRLLLEFRKRLPQGEFTYLEGRCLHYGGSMPYLPMLDILRSYFDIKREDLEAIIKEKMTEKVLRLDKRLKSVLPPFQEILSLKVEDEAYLDLEPGQKRERVSEAFRNLFVRLSQNRLLVLVVEDLHWIDKTSEEFLDYLIGWLAGTRILLILFYRPEYTHPWGSKSYYNRIGLDQLTAKSSTELVQAMLEGGQVVPELRELILGRASGNPLYMEELTHTLLENGSIQRKKNQYVLSAKASEIQIPDTIQGIISARMDRLEDNLKRIMQVASVIGRDFAFRILQAITGVREELKSYLLNLQGLEFIYEKSLFPELEYIFKHALIQEVAYNSLLQKRRREIHEKIGKAIEQIYMNRLEEFYEMLAYHYSKSEDSEKAYKYLKLSGEKAISSHSILEAFYFLNTAFQVLKRQPENEDNQKKKLEILHLILWPMMAVGYPGDSLQLLMQGEEISKRIGDNKSLAIFYSRMGRYYSLKEGKLSLGIKYSEKSFQEAEKVQDFELITRTGFDLFPSYAVAGQLSRIKEISPKIIALLEKTRKKHESFGSGWNVYSAAHGYYGLTMGWMGYFDEGKEILERGLRFTMTDVDDKFSLGWVEMTYGWILNIKGEGENALEYIRKAIDVLEEIKAYTILGIAWNHSGWGHHLMGEFETARKNIEKALKIQQDTGMSFWVSFPFLLLSMVHHDSGDLENAQEYIKEAITLSEQNNENSVLGYSRIWMGRILGRVDLAKRDEANEFIRQGIELLDKLKIKPWSSQGYLFLGELYLNTGDTETALENLKRAEGMFHEMGMDYWLAKTQELLETV